MKEKLNPGTSVLILMTLLLFFFTLIHSYGMLFGNEQKILSYLNVNSREPLSTVAPLYKPLMKCVGILAISACILFLVSLIKREVLTERNNYTVLKWAVFAAILSVVFYGGLVRSISNQQGSAILFFFSALLYLLFWYLEKKNKGTSNKTLNNLCLLPLYLLLLYTMGLPGWAKIFGGTEVTAKYNDMFKDTFIALLPGGTPMMILVLGILELLVPLLLLVSLLKGEFRKSAEKKWLSWSLVLTVLTFTMLCFGLTILFNFAGSVNLAFYALFTFFILIEFNPNQEQNI